MMSISSKDSMNISTGMIAMYVYRNSATCRISLSSYQAMEMTRVGHVNAEHCVTCSGNHEL